MNLARIRKAIIAGVGTAAGALLTGLVSAAEGGLTIEEAGAVVGAAVVAGLGVGRVAWRVPNAPE